MVNVYKKAKQKHKNPEKNLLQSTKRIETFITNLEIILNTLNISEEEKTQRIQKTSLLYFYKRKALTDFSHLLQSIKKTNREIFLEENIDAFKKMFLEAYNYDNDEILNTLENNTRKQHLEKFLDKLYETFPKIKDKKEIYKDLDERISLVFGGKEEDIFYNLALGNMFIYDEESLFYDEHEKKYYLDKEKNYPLIEPIKGKRTGHLPPKGSSKDEVIHRKIYDFGAHKKVAIDLKKHPLIQKVKEQFRHLFLSKELKELKNFNQLMEINFAEEQKLHKKNVFLNRSAAFYYLIGVIQKETGNYFSESIYNIFKIADKPKEEITPEDIENCRLKIVIAKDKNGDLYPEDETRAKLFIETGKYEEIYLSTEMALSEQKLKEKIISQAYTSNQYKKILENYEDFLKKTMNSNLDENLTEDNTEDNEETNDENYPPETKPKTLNNKTISIGNVDEITKTINVLLETRDHMVFRSAFLMFDKKDRKIKLNKNLYKRFIYGTGNIKTMLEKKNNSNHLGPDDIFLAIPHLIVDAYKVTIKMEETGIPLIRPKKTLENILNHYENIKEDFAPYFNILLNAATNRLTKKDLKTLKNRKNKENFLKTEFTETIKTYIEIASNRSFLVRIFKETKLQGDYFDNFVNFMFDKQYLGIIEKIIIDHNQDYIDDEKNKGYLASNIKDFVTYYMKEDLDEKYYKRHKDDISNKLLNIINISNIKTSQTEKLFEENILKKLEEEKRQNKNSLNI